MLIDQDGQPLVVGWPKARYDAIDEKFKDLGIVLHGEPLAFECSECQQLAMHYDGPRLKAALEAGRFLCKDCYDESRRD